MAVMGECADAVPAGHYSAILRRNPSTSSRMFKEKNLGNSVDDGVRDNGGMCCKAFLGEKKHKNNPQNPSKEKKITTINVIRTETLQSSQTLLFLHEECVLLCALKDSLSQRRVGLHGCGDQGGEERQVPDG